MVVAPTIISSGQSEKAIEIQLPLEACELRLTEIVGHHMVYKFFGFVNNEATSMGAPRHNVGKSIFLNLIENSMELHGKRYCYASSASTFCFLFIVFVGVGRVIVVVMDNEMTIVLLCRLAWLLWLSTTFWAFLLFHLLGRKGRDWRWKEVRSRWKSLLWGY